MPLAIARGASSQIAADFVERPKYPRSALLFATYIAGVVAVSLLMTSVERFGLKLLGWQIWLIYTGLYATTLLVLPVVSRNLQKRAHARRRIKALTRASKEQSHSREIALSAQDNHVWKKAMSRVTALTMLGSCATTALGFYLEVATRTILSCSKVASQSASRRWQHSSSGRGGSLSSGACRSCPAD